ncbi:copper amine oxidase N-terminal domain-containing protein [Paenibacillus wenxiniae]|uniref:Copper amine oxidase N-terminal domain-containing protein n=1 Tax=Paenibacillus wenxiniae TaxID=1636843 RepID=A0ABW4RLH0_9BACL
MTVQPTMVQQTNETQNITGSGNITMKQHKSKALNKVITSLLVASMIAVSVPMFTPQATAASASVEVLLNARKMAFPDAKPFQDENSAVMVPIRFISEKLGAKVGYEQSGGKQTVTLKTDKHSVTLTVGSPTAVVDGESKTYDSKIIVKQQRTYVPLRLVSEGLGQTVDWDGLSKWVWIGSKVPPTVDELGLAKTSLDPYKAFFSKKSYLLKDEYGTPFQYAIKITLSDFPLLMSDYIYSMDLYTFHDGSAYDGRTYIRVRSHAWSPNLFFLTNKGDVRYRYDRKDLLKKNNDGTVYTFYAIYAERDELLDHIKDAKPLTIQDIKYVGFHTNSSKDSLILMDNPWRQ